ncbi:MAG: HU family DNA-binding protein [Planctomycetes bacterium]|nr:HU family DNA-binding protein [Planctomycetota bacterium]
MAKKNGKAAKAAPTPKPPKLVAAAKPRKKSELFGILAEHVPGISKKHVAGMFEALGKVISVDLAKPSPDKPKVFVVPGMMKISAIHKPATKATQKPNPFKPGEMMTVKAKPARTVVKVRPLKALKEMV